MDGVSVGGAEKEHGTGGHVDCDVDLSDLDIQKIQLEIIKDRVRVPPPRVFGPRDLKWDLEYRPPRGEHKKSHVVQQCFIPTDRVQDFIQGMQCGREGAQCRFRPNKENRRPNLSRDGPRTALNFVRYRKRFHCHIVKFFVLLFRSVACMCSVCSFRYLLLM